MDENKPIAWMRRWAYEGEIPKKVKNETTGRMIWPAKFKMMAVTLTKCFSDDVPLYPPHKSSLDEE